MLAGNKLSLRKIMKVTQIWESESETMADAIFQLSSWLMLSKLSCIAHCPGDVSIHKVLGLPTSTIRQGSLVGEWQQTNLLDVNRHLKLSPPSNCTLWLVDIKRKKKKTLYVQHSEFNPQNHRIVNSINSNTQRVVKEIHCQLHQMVNFKDSLGHLFPK